MAQLINVSCKHFRGVYPHKTCGAGVTYSEVRIAGADGYGWIYPCFQRYGRADLCVKCEYPSAKEIAAEEAEVQRVAIQFFERLVSGVCTVCGGQVIKEVKVGRCVYAEPCGHRMYQGRPRKGANNG